MSKLGSKNGLLLLVTLAAAGVLLVWLPSKLVEQYDRIKSLGPPWTYIYFALIGTMDRDHCFAAHRAGRAVVAFMANCVKPQGIDRFRLKRLTQQFNRNGASTAILAAPNRAPAGLDFLQRQIAARAGQRRFHGHRRALSQKQCRMKNLSVDLTI